MKKTTWKVAHFSDLSSIEVYEILKLRSDVFIVEQERAVLEIDGKDLKESTLHILGIFDNHIVAYARIVEPGVTFNDETSIERVVVSKNHRRSGLGRILMEKVVKAIKVNYQNTPVKIHAQKYLEDFYMSFGFKKVGKPFVEDGIPHIFLVSTDAFSVSK